jgi:hypothetical protein
MSSDCLGIPTVCCVGSANSLIGNGHRDVAKSRRNCDRVTTWISSIRGAVTTKKKSCPCIHCSANPDNSRGEGPLLVASLTRDWQKVAFQTNLTATNFLAICVVNFASLARETSEPGWRVVTIPACSRTKANFTLRTVVLSRHYIAKKASLVLRKVAGNCLSVL